MRKILIDVLRATQYLLDTNAVSELLNLQPDTIHRYCRKGVIPHIRIGNTYRFDPTELADWVESQQYSVGGNIPGTITDWVEAHVLDRTLELPIPTALAGVLAELGETWMDTAKVALNLPQTDDQLHSRVVFQTCLNQRLTVLEQRELLTELRWLEVHHA